MWVCVCRCVDVICDVLFGCLGCVWCFLAGGRGLAWWALVWWGGGWV